MPPPRKHPARVCPHAEADIAEAAGGVGTHPDGHTLAHLGTHPSPLSRAAWGQTLRFPVPTMRKLLSLLNRIARDPNFTPSPEPESTRKNAKAGRNKKTA